MSFVAASTSSETPRTMPPPTKIRNLGRLSMATVSAAVRAPAPMDANSNPRPDGPALSAPAAMTGRTTLKFIPNVETNPITATARSTGGVARRTSARRQPDRTAPMDRGIASRAAGINSLSRIASRPMTTAP